MNQKKVSIKFPDGNEKEFLQGVSLEEIAESISLSLKKKSVAGRVNGVLYDFRRSIDENAQIELVELPSTVGIDLMRHTTAHVMAQAVKRIYGNVHLGIGPVIENGFYYDFDLENSITISELNLIEKEMNKIISENIEIVREEISREEAKEIFASDPL